MRLEPRRERLVFQIPRMLLEARDRNHARLRHLIRDDDARDLPYFLLISDFGMVIILTLAIVLSRRNVFARAIACLGLVQRLHILHFSGRKVKSQRTQLLAVLFNKARKLRVRFHLKILDIFLFHIFVLDPGFRRDDPAGYLTITFVFTGNLYDASRNASFAFASGTPSISKRILPGRTGKT